MNPLSQLTCNQVVVEQEPSEAKSKHGCLKTKNKRIVTAVALGVLGVTVGATLTGLFIKDAYDYSSSTQKRSTALALVGTTIAICSFLVGGFFTASACDELHDDFSPPEQSPRTPSVF